jgi:pyruvate dehydrogenase E1 component
MIDTIAQRDLTPSAFGHGWDGGDVAMLDRIQGRVLWLSTYMIHYANFLREGVPGIKVGGHQASSSSVVTLLTALYFHHLRPNDLVSIKPHASPVFHAIQFLRGMLSGEKLRAFRQFGGLQAYPSRTKDSDRVDFSTGSVGLGAVAPIFGALVRDYVADHFGHNPDAPGSGWHIALVGDAELDEGNVWEALGEDFVRHLSKVLWIVDLNRQSLDRVTPSGRAQRLREMFRSNGWKVIDLKYGKRLEAIFARPGGAGLRSVLDQMSNEEYQSLLLKDGETIRARLGARDPALAELLADHSASQCKALLANLGGHDLESVLSAYDQAFATTDRPVVVFAYTIKGWGLPLAGNPANHARLLKPPEIESLREELQIAPGDEFSGFAEGSEEARYIRGRMALAGFTSRDYHRVSACAPSAIPGSLGLHYHGMLSTQSAMGSVLVNLDRLPAVAPYLVTVSPDVATSTNLGGWIHRVGIYSKHQGADFFKELGIPLPINWQESVRGRHIELGISETNLFMQLAMLGLAGELYGQPLLPIGTVYDPFVCRALDAFIYGLYSHSRFIAIGTPSGITLSYEGGAHQSIITPGIGAQLPGLTYYEPAFGQEVEWILLDALARLHDPRDAHGTYLRLSTKPIDQAIFSRLLERNTEETLREQVLRGGYRLIDQSAEPEYRPDANVVHILATGVMAPEAVEAAQELKSCGVLANVFLISSADRLFHENLRHQRSDGSGSRAWLEGLVPAAERIAPLVTVHDGHPLTLAALAGALSTRIVNLGVTAFGQTGEPQALYRACGISTRDIVEAAQRLLARGERLPG